jgi:hypothetical protein
MLPSLLTARDDELIEGQRRIEWMIDRLALMYLIHTPEVPDELHDGAVATARRRYTNYRRVVANLPAPEKWEGVEGDGSHGGEDAE